jgi:hypothetical protein
MFSSTIRRSVATLGVVAGLLASAVPASAAGPGGVPGNQPNDALDAVKAPTKAKPASIQLGAANDVSTLPAEANGTQVGSEGVKAPKSTSFKADLPVDSTQVTVDAGSGDDSDTLDNTSGKANLGKFGPRAPLSSTWGAIEWTYS